MQIVSAGKPHFRWKKRGSHFSAKAVPGWSLTLDLVAANNRRRGSLTVYRLYDGRDLQLDMNLLTSVLPVALADALDRVLRQAVEIKTPAQEAAAAAQAS